MCLARVAVTFSQPGKSKIQAQTKSAIEKFARRSLLDSLSFRDCELFAMRSREPHLRAGTAPDGLELRMVPVGLAGDQADEPILQGP